METDHDTRPTSGPDVPRRSVVSFTDRGGRMTAGQQRAWDRLWTRFGANAAGFDRDPDGPRPPLARRPAGRPRLVRPTGPAAARDRLRDGRDDRRPRRRRARRRPRGRRGLSPRARAAAHAPRGAGARQPAAAARRRRRGARGPRRPRLARRPARLLPRSLAEAPAPQAPPGPARDRRPHGLAPRARRDAAPRHRRRRLRRVDARGDRRRAAAREPARRLRAAAGVAPAHQVRGPRRAGGTPEPAISSWCAPRLPGASPEHPSDPAPGG